jgi:hypothetical protein
VAVRRAGRSLRDDRSVTPTDRRGNPVEIKASVAQAQPEANRRFEAEAISVAVGLASRT